jgi:hypothetical protein
MAGLGQADAPPLAVERVVQELERITDHANGESFDVKRERPGSNITGYVVRREFRGLNSADRQKNLRTFLVDRFGPESTEIGLVLTFTPEEFDDWLEDARGL